jgi:hypothetical protein
VTPLQQVEAILDAFANGNLSWSDASAMLPHKRKLWSSRWWKARRDELIKPVCEVCGTDEGPMTLQHNRQPLRISDARSLVEKKQAAVGGPRFWEVLERIRRRSLPMALLSTRNACPFCDSLSIYYRKGTNEWVCISRKHRNNVFSAPARRPARCVKYNANDAIFLRAKTDWEASSHYEAQEREARRMVLQSWVKYMSLADTKTACRRCAFIEALPHINRTMALR